VPCTFNLMPTPVGEDGVNVQALKHVKSMKLVEGSYAAKEMALDKINALISIVEQSESQKEVGQVRTIHGLPAYDFQPVVLLHTVRSAIGIILSSVCLSACDEVYPNDTYYSTKCLNK